MFIAAGEDAWNIDAGFVPIAGQGGTVTGRVWADGNINGRQDTGEVSVAGILIRLINATTGQVVATAVTDSSGLYSFGGVAPGNYFLQITLPSGAGLTLANAAPDNVDSDFYQTTAVTNVFTLPAGGTSDLDAGLIPAPP